MKAYKVTLKGEGFIEYKVVYVIADNEDEARRLAKNKHKRFRIAKPNEYYTEKECCPCECIISDLTWKHCGITESGFEPHSGKGW